MTETQRSVLFIGFDRAAFDRIASYAERKGYFADWVEAPRDALELLTLLPFDALVLAHPLSDLTARFVLQAVRRPESLNRTAGVVVVCDTSRAEDASGLVEQGANAVLFPDDAPAQLPRILKELSQVEPRVPKRLTCRIRARLGVVDVQSLCQTVNLSKSGMLLRGDQVIPVGTEISFELQISADPKPIRGRGKVVRHTFERKEHVAGLGAIFLGFEESDDLRLQIFLDNS